MTPYFEPWSRQQALALEARRWEGTPFRYRCAIPQRGADCAPFIWAIGSRLHPEIPPVRTEMLPPYTHGHSKHNDAPILPDWLERMLSLWGIPWERIDHFCLARPGDLMLFTPTRCPHHIGIHYPYLKESPRQRLLHCSSETGGVALTDMAHPWFPRLFSHAYRIMESTTHPS